MTQSFDGQPPHRPAPFDVVRLPSGLPQYGVAPGSRAVILDIHDDPYLAYEIEVADDSGQTLYVGAVDPAQIEFNPSNQ